MSTRQGEATTQIVELGYTDINSVTKIVDGNDPLPTREQPWQKHLYGWDTDIVTNGAFAADSDWTKGAGWTIAAGVATHATANPGTTLTEDSALKVAIVAGATYRVTYTITSYTSGAVAVSLGGTAGTSRSAAGTYTEDITAKTASSEYVSSIVFTADATNDFDGSIDNVVSYKRVTDGVFTLTPLNAVESILFLDLQQGFSGLMDIYFKTLTSLDATALDGMTFQGRQGYFFDDSGENDQLVDGGAANEITLSSSVDMSVVGTVDGPYSVTEEYTVNGSKSKFMHGPLWVVACTNVGGVGGDTGTILAYVGKR